MALIQITHSVTIEQLSLDSWSETYIGARWLIMEELPTKQWEAASHHGPLSQMVLIASHHLIEVMFFQCIREILNLNPGKYSKIERKIDKTRFFDAFTEWPANLSLAPFDMNIQPYVAVDGLRKRRNDTIHQKSALTTLPMARSALYTAVEGSRAIESHLLGSKVFKYETVLKKYPIEKQLLFSEINFVP